MPDVSKPESTDDASVNPTMRGLRYVLSLPERTVRSGAGLLGGALRESAALLVPQTFQNSRTYTVMVRQMLDFVAEDIGSVSRSGSDNPESAPRVDNFVARKAVGNFVEMAALATLHVSPLTLLAVVSDVAYGSQAYLRELADELKREGVIDEASTIHHANDLLAAVAEASRNTSQVFDTPPLSVEGLKQTIEETRQAIRGVDPMQIIPEAEIRRLWEEMRQISQRDQVSLLSVSGAMAMQSLERIGVLGRGALSSVKVAGKLFDRHVVDHYWQAVGRIREQGFYRSLAATSEPYIEAVWENFSTQKTTVTEEILTGKLIGSAWTAARRWLGGKPDEPADGISAQTDQVEPAPPLLGSEPHETE